MATPKSVEEEKPLGSDVDELLAMLGQASRELAAERARTDKLLLLMADLSARMYVIEVNTGLRQSGALTIDGLRFAGNASRATYASVVQRVLLEFNAQAP